jgi:hypothetical protein
MGVPTSEEGYTSATTRREIMKSKMDMWWHWIKENKPLSCHVRVVHSMNASYLCIHLITNAAAFWKLIAS